MRRYSMVFLELSKASFAIRSCRLPNIRPNGQGCAKFSMEDARGIVQLLVFSDRIITVERAGLRGCLR